MPSDPLKDLLSSATVPNCSATALHCLHECPRKFLFRNFLGLSRRGFFSESLIIGTLYHSARASCLGGTQDALSSVSEEVESLTREVKDSADLDTGRLPSGQSLDQVLTMIQKSASLALALSAVACKVFPWPETPSDIWTTKVEVPFSVHPLPFLPGFSITGRFDALTTHYNPILSRDETWIMEHKTTSADLPSFMTIAAFSIQNRLYMQSLSHLDPPGIPAGILMEVLQKPGIRQKKNETLEEFTARVLSWYNCTGEYEDLRESRLVSPVYERRPLRFPVQDEELEILLGRFEDSVACDPRMIFLFPKQTHSCISYGKSVCPFLPLCSIDPSEWPGMIERGLFTRKVVTSHDNDPPDTE